MTDGASGRKINADAPAAAEGVSRRDVLKLAGSALAAGAGGVSVDVASPAAVFAQPRNVGESSGSVPGSIQSDSTRTRPSRSRR